MSGDMFLILKTIPDRLLRCCARAILANTRNAAECCGILDQTGTIEPGKYADLISLRGNPLEDIRNVREKGMIMVGGRIYDPATRYWKGLDPVEIIMSK